MITITYVNTNDPKDVLKLELVEGKAKDESVHEKVLAENTPYEMVAVMQEDGTETRFDLDYPDPVDEASENMVEDFGDAESEPEAYDMSVEEEAV